MKTVLLFSLIVCSSAPSFAGTFGNAWSGNTNIIVRIKGTDARSVNVFSMGLDPYPWDYGAFRGELKVNETDSVFVDVYSKWEGGYLGTGVTFTNCNEINDTLTQIGSTGSYNVEYNYVGHYFLPFTEEFLDFKMDLAPAYSYSIPIARMIEYTHSVLNEIPRSNFFKLTIDNDIPQTIALETDKDVLQDIMIFDMCGRKVYSAIVNDRKSGSAILNSIAAGIYILRGDGKKSVYTKKIFIE